MACHKLTVVAVAGFLWAVTAPCWAGSAVHVASPTPPKVPLALQKYLSRVARRTIRDSLLGRSAYTPDYVPHALAEQNAEAVVRLWHDGYLMATGVGGFGPVALSVTQAASVAGASLTTKFEPTAGEVSRMRIEIEVAGRPVAIPFQGDWTEAGALDGFVEPGVHGIIVIGKKKGRRVYPSEIIWRGFAMHKALEGIAKATQIDPKKPADTTLQRFATRHWIQSRSGTDTSELFRGMILVPASDVNQKTIGKAIDSLLDYVLYRQQPNGLFSYEFLPGADRYVANDHLLRQLGATAAVSWFAQITGRDAVQSAADVSIRYHRQGLRELAGVEGAVFLSTADDANSLGATALFLLALSDHPEYEKFSKLRGQLVTSILSLQRDSGMFLTAFPPAVKINEQDYFPGEALFALAAENSRQASPKILAAFDRALRFYRDYSQTTASAAFTSWQTRAFATMAIQTRQQRFADYVFELADRAAGAQLTGKKGDAFVLDGAIVTEQGGHAGASTALHLSALCDAAAVARKFGDQNREQGYVAAVRHAVRFVMQLQFREGEAFFAKSPRDVLGGIRTSPSRNYLRIDHAYQALTALLKTQRTLYRR